MTHKIEWLSFPRILYIDLYGDLTLEDIESFSNDTIQYIEEGKAPVHIIIDDSKVGKPPIRLNSLKQSLRYAQHPSLGWHVAIGDVNPVVNYVAPMIMKIFGVNFLRRKTKENALDFLYRQDSTLKVKDLS